jgi:hypothetical protein
MVHIYLLLNNTIPSSEVKKEEQNYKAHSIMKNENK